MALSNPSLSFTGGGGGVGPTPVTWAGGLSYTGLSYNGRSDSGAGPGGATRPWGFGDPVTFDGTVSFDGLFAPDYNPWNWGTAAMKFDDPTATMDGTYTP